MPGCSAGFQANEKTLGDWCPPPGLSGSEQLGGSQLIPSRSPPVQPRHNQTPVEGHNIYPWKKLDKEQTLNK